MVAPTGLIAVAPAGAAAVLTCKPPSGSVTFTPGLGHDGEDPDDHVQPADQGLQGHGRRHERYVEGLGQGHDEVRTAHVSPRRATKTTVTITWNNKKTSIVDAERPRSSRAPRACSRRPCPGKITKGLFVGKTLKTKVKVTLRRAWSALTRTR